MSLGGDEPAAIVFDGDDTLWSTEPLYDQARNSAMAEVAAAGLDADKWESLERRLDVENVARFGFSVERFPTSCVEAYEALAIGSGIPIDQRLSERIRSAARAVFRQDPPLVPNARETLLDLRGRGIKLGLLTKGDRDLQLRRVEHSGLKDLFDVVHVVADKPPAAFRDMVGALGCAPQESWSVGNSVRSDILPAIAAGLRAVWIDAHVWEHEHYDQPFSHGQVLVANDLAQLSEAIAGALKEG